MSPEKWQRSGRGLLLKATRRSVIQQPFGLAAQLPAFAERPPDASGRARRTGCLGLRQDTRVGEEEALLRPVRPYRDAHAHATAGAPALVRGALPVAIYARVGAAALEGYAQERPFRRRHAPSRRIFSAASRTASEVTSSPR